MWMTAHTHARARHNNYGGTMPGITPEIVLLAANLLLAAGAIVGGAISWVRDGMIKKIAEGIASISQIQQDVQEINNWKNDVELILLALSESDKSVDDEVVRETFDIGLDTDELIERQKTE